jgi:hypothetical protein
MPWVPPCSLSAQSSPGGTTPRNPPMRAAARPIAKIAIISGGPRPAEKLLVTALGDERLPRPYYALEN